MELLQAILVITVVGNGLILLVLVAYVAAYIEMRIEGKTSRQALRKLWRTLK